MAGVGQQCQSWPWGVGTGFGGGSRRLLSREGSVTGWTEHGAPEGLGNEGRMCRCVPTVPVGRPHVLSLLPMASLTPRGRKPGRASEL